MKKVISFLAMTFLLAFTPNPNQQEKEYKASLTINEWNLSLANQDDVPLNQRKAIAAKIVEQIQKQIASDTLKKK